MLEELKEELETKKDDIPRFSLLQRRYHIGGMH
jgi:hypothetical protein